MPAGPGVYDDLATLIRERADAEGVVIIVCNGNRGQGFSVQVSPRLMRLLPDMLEQVVKDMRASAIDK